MNRQDNPDLKMPVFIRSGPQWAEAESGFVVRFAGQYRLEYVEKNHTLAIPIDELVRPFKVLLYLSKAKAWQAPYDKEPISPERMATIQFNIMEAMNHLKTPFEAR